MTHRSIVCGAAIAAALCFSTAALAQTKPKKPKTPATTTEAEPPKTEPAATEEPKTTPEAEPADKAAKPKSSEPPSEEWDDTDVTEKPGKKYYFIGLRYRGTVVPKFLMNMFVDEGATFYSNTIGVELDVRKDDFSLIPAISYVEYGTDDILFKEKSKADVSNNWSVVNSSLKGIYITADLLWSTKVHKNWDLEYGAGFGLGVIFGNLQNNWVYGDPNGPLKRENGVRYSRCETEQGRDVPNYSALVPTVQGETCARPAHSNSADAKVGGYKEKFWTGGGSVPNLFIHLALPQLGVRFKPRKDFQARLGFGFSLTGFWFGLNGNYGMETALDKGKTTASRSQQSGPRLETTTYGQPMLMPLAF